MIFELGERRLEKKEYSFRSFHQNLFLQKDKQRDFQPEFCPFISPRFLRCEKRIFQKMNVLFIFPCSYPFPIQQY